MSDKIPADIYQWVEKHTDKIRLIEALKGGISTSVYRLNCDAGDFVLRVIDNTEWLVLEPDLAEHEAAGLRLLENYDIPAPRLIAFDNGNDCSLPVVLSTFLAGQITLDPDDLHTWLHELASVMAKLHQMDMPDFNWQYQSWFDAETVKITPQWIQKPHLWQKAVAICQQSRLRYESPCLIHRDYHPGNVLFQDGRISGVVDWINICQGMSSVDLATCRIDVMCLQGVDASNQLMRYYQDISGIKHYPVWDIYAFLEFFDSEDSNLKQVLRAWHEQGRTDLNLPLIYRRANAFLEDIVRGD